MEKPVLNQLNIVVSDFGRSTEFYRRLGVTVPPALSARRVELVALDSPDASTNPMAAPLDENHFSTTPMASRIESSRQ